MWPRLGRDEQRTIAVRAPYRPVENRLAQDVFDQDSAFVGAADSPSAPTAAAWYPCAFLRARQWELTDRFGFQTFFHAKRSRRHLVGPTIRVLVLDDA